MKILITGANGLVGSAIARQFTEAGWQVFALMRASADKTLLNDISHKITFLEGDLLDIMSLEKAIIDVDYVIHAAAMVSFLPKERDAMYKVNIEGTANLVNACLEKHYRGNPLTNLCFVSSIAALGRPVNLEKKSEISIDENQKWEDSPLNSHYAKTKYLAECEIWRGEAEGLKVVVVNPSLVLGEGDWKRSSTQLFKYAFDEKRYYPKGNLNYVDVKDVAEICYKLIEKNISGERFTLNAGTISYKDFFGKVANNFGKRSPQKAISQWMTEVLWRTEIVRSWITGKAPLITKETAKTSHTNFIFTNDKISKVLDYQFITLDETLRRVCKYLQPN